MGKTIFLVLALFVSGVSVAEEGGACSIDIKKYCSDVPAGEGRIVKCLKDHDHELSPDCKAKGQAAKEKIKDAVQACKTDAEKYCARIPAGGGRIKRCLKGQGKTKLSAECASSLGL